MNFMSLAFRRQAISAYFPWVRERDYLFGFQEPLKHLQWDGAALLGHPGE